MSFHYTNKDGKKRSISSGLLDLFGGDKKLQETMQRLIDLRAQAKEDAEAANASKAAIAPPVLSREGAKTITMIGPTGVEKEVDIDDIAKEQEALAKRMKDLQGLIQKVKVTDKGTPNKKSGNVSKENGGNKSNAQPAAGPAAGPADPHPILPWPCIREGGYSETDPTWQYRSIEEGGGGVPWPWEEVPKIEVDLTHEQLQLLIRLYKSFEIHKYLSIASRFYDATGIEIEPEDVQSWVDTGKPPQ